MKDFYEFLPPLNKPKDFEAFWERKLEKSKKVPLNLRVEKMDYPSVFNEVYEIIFNGYDDTDIYGSIIKPVHVSGKMPVLFYYHGFFGHHGSPIDYMHYTALGITVVAIDIRGQNGKTKDQAIYYNEASNISCKGIINEDEYYYGNVYADCIKVLDIVDHFDYMDQNRIIIDGVSQGGGLVMAVAALDNRPKLALADIPSQSYYEGRYQTATGHVNQIVEYVKENPKTYERVMKTLSYFDTMNMADKINCKVLASVGLEDNTCPAKFYFATYNRITSPKEVKFYQVGHQVPNEHKEYKLRCIMENIGPEVKEVTKIDLSHTNCQLIAHRGLSGIAPENTMEAFQLAVDKGGYYGIETDIHVSKDREFIISHDASLKRMTNDERLIKDLTVDEIKKIDVVNGNNNFLFEDVKTPLLKEFLSLCEEVQIVPVIEIKEVIDNTDLDRLLNLIDTYELPDCIIISFNVNYLIYLRQKNSSIKIQYLISSITEEFINVCLQYNFDIDTNYGRLTKELIALCHHYDLIVNAWTIDDKDIALNFAESGLDFITTNKLKLKD